MNRVAAAFARARSEGRAALVVYLTHGDPTPAATPRLIAAAVAAGADVIELGVPFSDPSADGPVIQAAMVRALGAGAGLDDALAAVATVRADRCDVPIVLFGYYNPIFTFGVDRFAERARAAGVDAVLTVDLPIDELAELSIPLGAAGVAVVPLAAPTSTDERIAKLADFAPPFVYYISTTGVTGGAFRGSAGGAGRVAVIRNASGAPVAVGFGIRSSDDVRAVAAFADGVVVGSAIVERIAAANGDVERAATAIGSLIGELRSALR